MVVMYNESLYSRLALFLAISIVTQGMWYVLWNVFSASVTTKHTLNTFSPRQIFPRALDSEVDTLTKREHHIASNTLTVRSSSATTPQRRSLDFPHLSRELPTLCSGRSGYSKLTSADHVSASVSSFEIQTAFEQLVGKYLSPWIPLNNVNTTPPRLTHPITGDLLNSMEVLIRGGAFRVRLAGDGTIRYRVQEHWGQTYRISRMTWTLDLLQEAMEKYPELAKLKCEFYVNVADSPRSTVDSMSRDMGGIPVFSFRTSSSYLDVPVPDPVEYGSNGNYVWKTQQRVPYEERIPKLVFRGSASSLHEYHDDNWLSVPRIRLAALSKEYPHLIDAGITKWMKLRKGTTTEKIVNSVGTGLSTELSYEEQGKYRFILDLDGGLGSSRKRGILNSGSVPFFEKSNWYMWYEPLLKPFHHFIPVETYLHDLVQKVEKAREDKADSRRTVERAECFAASVVTREGAMLYWKTLLERYSELQLNAALGGEDVKPSMCSLRPATAEGPMGCSDGWYIYNGSVPFGCRYVGAKRRRYLFECWRNIGQGVEFKFTSDPVHSSYD